MTNKLFFDIKPELNAFEAVCKEQKYIGYYNLPEQDLEYLEEYKRDFNAKNKDIKHLVIIGIGGSSLGLKAIYKTLKNIKDFSKKIYFLESTDPIAIKTELKKVELKKAHFFIISKSGTTLETTAIYKYVLGLLSKKKIAQEHRFTYITDKGSLLEAHAKSKRSFCLFIPKNIGGRFSVLSPVGLLSARFSGIDIRELLRGAQDAESKVEIPNVINNPAFLLATIYYLLFTKRNKNISKKFGVIH